MTVLMTKQQALDIQLKQLTHYAEVYGGAAMAPVIARICGSNRPEELDDGKEYPSWEIHRCIPCGAAIEAVMIELGIKRGFCCRPGQ
jgi:hypothetical protein